MPLGTPRRAAVVLLSAAAAVAAVAGPAAAAGHRDKPAAPAVHLRLFAAAPAGASKPDDITRLGDLLYVTYQNNAGPDGTPAGSTSTVVALDRHTGKVVHTYQLPGRCDGLAADPRHHRILASVNEDLNSSLYVLTPGRDNAITHYTYSPNPAQTGTDGTNGGTDAIAVTPEGTIYIAHSNPDPTLPAPDNAAAVYRLTLGGSTAKLSPVFGINDTATVINPAAGAARTAPLALTDPDSNSYLPGLDGGTLIQDAQADSKLVFASHLQSGRPQLRQLNLTNATTPKGGAVTPHLDDITPVSGDGTLYVVDQKAGNIYATTTSGVESGTLFVSQPSGDANDPALGVVNPRTGVVTHVATLGSPKGLLFVSSSDDNSSGDNQSGDNQSSGDNH